MKTVYYILILLCCGNCKQAPCEKQKLKEFDKKLEELVLSEKIVGREYFTKVHLDKEILEFKMTFLGSIETLKKVNLHFLYTTVYTGLYEDSKRANSIIAIYSDEKRLGQYYVGGGFGKTPIIIKDEIIIGYNDEDCNQYTHISFKDSIPNQIFIHCKEKNGQMFGDFYNFEKEKYN